MKFLLIFLFLVGEDVQGGNLALEKFVINKVFYFRILFGFLFYFIEAFEVCAC